jgi:putative SOS response-associated peptidase YedK
VRSRYSLTKSPQEIGKYFDVPVPQGLHPDREVIGFAGLAREVRIDGETRSECVILTCKPAGNLIASEIHDRTPAVLADRSEQQQWMDPGIGVEHAASLCRVLPESRLRRKRVNPMLKPTQPGQEQLQLI